MTRYHPLLVALHWVLAAMIVGAMLFGGQVLSETPNSEPGKARLLALHMGSGLAILGLTLARLGTRLFTAHPPRADIGNAALNRLGVATHWAFYVLVIALCVSGIALSAGAGLPEIVFGGAQTPLPEDFDAYPARAAHGAIATALGLLILGHVGAAAYHQIMRGDRLLSRMWFGSRRG